MSRFQFSLKWLFVAMLVVAAFFAGIHFERQRRNREDESYESAPQGVLTIKELLDQPRPE
jgi:hypothetical protein